MASFYARNGAGDLLARYSFLEPLLAGKRVLEMGAARATDGGTALFLAERGAAAVLSLEPNEGDLAASREAGHHPFVQFRAGAPEELRGGTFDLVLVADGAAMVGWVLALAADGEDPDIAMDGTLAGTPETAAWVAICGDEPCGLAGLQVTALPVKPLVEATAEARGVGEASEEANRRIAAAQAACDEVVGQLAARDAALAQAVAERDDAVRARDDARVERDQALSGRETARAERDGAISSREAALAAVAEARSAREAGAAELEEARVAREGLEQSLGRLRTE